jgi:hypothetical protein
MQTREQIKNWKVVASMASVAALGLSGLAIASPGEDAQTPPPIEIQDRNQGGERLFPGGTQPEFQVVPGPSVTPDLDSLDSPLASADLDSPADDSPDDSPVDSPDDSPVDSPDDSPVDSPVDSPDDSPVDSPDDSPDDSPNDS